MESAEQSTPTPTPALNATAEFVVPGFGTPLPLYGWLGMLLPMLNNPYIQESLRFFFLGSVLETGRRLFQWTLDRFTSGFFVTAHFQQGDWAFDWLNEFLAAQEIWTNSREYRVTASNVEKEWTCAPGASSSTDNTLTIGTGKGETGGDGFPRPLYFPASDMPQVLRWQGHWVQITRKAGVMAFNGQTEENASLTLTVYTRKKKVLDDIVEEARLYYISTQKPPLAAQTKKSNLTLKATFEQADYTYSWLLEFLNSHNAWQNSNEVIVTAKSAEQKWGMILGNIEERDEKLRAYYQPASQSQHLWNWKGTWIQVQRMAGSRDYRTGKEEGASISLTLFTGRKETLDELVAAAAEQYWERSSRRVTVHMCESYGDWGATITKQIRPMDSVILPHGMTDLMLDDLRDFMDNKDWYAAAGIPWRRGVLLWGPPGTGKSTTVHAIAGELQLEIYCVPLSSNGIDDSSLQRLIASTPPNCILLLEDIDCAFPPRENEEDEADALSGQPFNPFNYGQPKSSVTLSGLLNLLDSVSSEEGRIVFATTNHIDRLDPALLRPGRMDLRIEYKNATHQQTMDLFSRFYSQELMTKTTKSTQIAEEAAKKAVVVSDEAAALIKKSDNSSFLAAVPTIDQVAELAAQFADKVPENRYSIAQLQGYLLCSKRDPRGAVKNIDEWVGDREKEQAEKDARLAKRAAERAKWLKMEKFRQKKEKQMEQDAEKEMLAEAEQAEKLEKEMENAADEDDAAEKKEKKEDEEDTKEDESKTADAASDKDSEPEMVESVTPSSSS
ncbi:hypothetical protein FRC04_011304 [Tulasnella sp. 424]|nr:hypothetical protein FRC04_011304 [Tulasnella sp. 424]KAG8975523.1 hypothetical protein FRC05_005592 [Tulasnella sp. 425]